jgi:hypothetical protein
VVLGQPDVGEPGLFCGDRRGNGAVQRLRVPLPGKLRGEQEHPDADGQLLLAADRGGLRALDGAGRHRSGEGGVVMSVRQ